MTDLLVEVTRNGHVESRHRICAAVVDESGRLVASSGDPGLVTFWRSAAKPFQALPLVQDGAADRFGFGPRELALACASHSSEPNHLEVCEGMLRAIGCDESELACGPHPPLYPAVADRVVREGITVTPRWNNCSGKHSGMLAQCRHRGWPTQGYNQQGHPLQERLLDEVVRWTDCPRDQILQVVDGCTAVCFGLPLRNMALSFARLGVSSDAAVDRLRQAMWAHPELVAGTGRLCTDLMAACRGTVLAKVGAEGVYSAAYAPLGLGIALKVEDGTSRASPPALLGILRQVVERLAPGTPLPFGGLGTHAEPPIKNTRGEVVGAIRVAGGLRFS
jgi:L-asparaginase II